MGEIRFPTDSQHLSIIGNNGSGKTQNAMWHLSHRNFHTMPWLIYNFKRDESIDALLDRGAIEIDTQTIPTGPGIYIVHPHPDDTQLVEAQMWAVWERGHTGIYVDEGYMIGRNNRAFRAILTQGRSKRIPVIVLSQRPVWMDKFVFSESMFFQVFRLNHKEDIKNVSAFVPADLGQRLPDYWSYYYDVGRNEVYMVKPVPDMTEILDTFHRRLRGRKTTL